MAATGPDTDNTPFFAMLERMLTAAGRRVAEGDAYDLAQLLNLRHHLDQVTAEAVGQLRAEGFAWEAIAEPLGVTRQACIMRWGRR